ncbi:LytR/AlgR family response regulator transcription factor [Runella slithyformis]|uniref:Two component transcriptional regulator, LytTR family n=1 Tax=Runella slithyformis (strain ATCC 29530 / DSM 19594 / LMG 11500 / NCIMB 11436 / LSU 4) TaxID=761193 RepID=A0A7U3ZN20_RUNSL|nr:LytTR family DNA-binding domain-containing protein [Runella slithyformis]AEI50242.1 two component transcriptional regulator, LytTR family [Runella slithyformis DSM 19594]
MKNKFTALIVEDDPFASSELAGYLHKTNMFEQPAIFSNVTESFNFLKLNAIDIIFLDLDLPDLPGLELLKMLPAYPSVIITSSHISLAIDCFDFEVTDFLTKPYHYTRLLRSIHRAVQKQHFGFEKPLSESPNSSKHIFLQVGRSSERLDLNDIVYVEAYGIYVKVITTTGVMVVNQMLSGIEETLPKTFFLRIHRSYLINLNHLKRINPNDLLVGSHQIPIGLSYKDKVRQKLKSDGIIH